MVAIDGRGGAGKSTLAAMVAQRVGAFVIDGDDFYRHENWTEFSEAERAELCIDWRSQLDVLEAILNKRPARWQPYDWESDNGQLSREWSVCQPGYRVVILEGTFSARPQLHDLLRLKVLLTVSRSQQRERFIEREGGDEWDAWAATWMGAEDVYFRHVMPPEAFDLTIRT